MNLELLVERIEKKKNQIEKSEMTLERHNKALDKKVSKIKKIDSSIDLSDYDKYSDSIRGDELYWELCDYEHKLEDIENTIKKINGYKKELEKLENTLSVERKKENDIDNVIPEVLKKYLNDWKKEVVKFYVKLANQYIDLKFKTYEVTREELKVLTKEKYNKETHKYEEVKKYTDEEIEEILLSDYLRGKNHSSVVHHFLHEFKKYQSSSDLIILSKIIDYDEIKMTTLEKIIDLEVKAKKELFVARVQGVTGIIQSLENFTIASNGEINGIAIGEKGKAKVNTIFAGGYNIQKLHFRVLVKEI